jgi:hypothetical protein
MGGRMETKLSTYKKMGQSDLAELCIQKDKEIAELTELLESLGPREPAEGRSEK